MKRALLLSALLLAACKQSSPYVPAGDVTATPSEPSATPELSTLALEPLKDGDGQLVADSMSNVGGCAFYDKDGRLLLSVGIPDGPGSQAIGVARPNGARTKLTAAEPEAGYVEGGPQLTGGGFTLTVMRPPGEGKALDREEVEYAADLVVSDGGGDARTYTPGGWRCGV